MLGTRIDARPRRRNSGRPDEKSHPGYLKWLRGRSCHVAKAGGCWGRIQAAHVDHAGDKGMGTKVNDRHALPLCEGHHAEQHSRGWRTFEATYRFDALEVSAAFWRAWPGSLVVEMR